MDDIKYFLQQVAYMRAAQATYFEKSAKARKTKLPADWAAASAALKLAKEYETSVDHQLKTLTQKYA